VRLLAAREHSRGELRRKLLARGFHRDDVERLLSDLVGRGLLSDARFVEAYVAERVRRGYGPLRVRAELRERGVEEILIDQGLEPFRDAWTDALSRAHDKKFGPLPPTDRMEFGRRARFLQYRGFTAEQVCRVLNFDP
jgi:regulatory protein